MIGRQSFVDAVNTKGLFLDTLHFQETVRVAASTELSAARSADLVFFCVKTTDNAATARELASFVSPDTVVISLQNGVDNVEQIRAASNLDAVPAVVYIAASVPEPGVIKHVGRGDLVVGPETGRTTRLAAQFVRAGIPCRISGNIEGELWTKFLINCALNAVSAVGQAKYGRLAKSSDARKLVERAVNEVLAVAQAAQVVLPEGDDPKAALATVLKIAEQMSEASSSTAQDLQRGKRTEIDSLNGYIVRRGAELGVPTPVNHALYTLVKLAEGR
jgi:2-dehydropantoate 2-reductase